ncbi:MAG: NAD(P)-dependent oxidoreductase [Chloroflexota bacterium]|nr:NAD(P)-dependent oxidoreductase [Chloroflexota bacterium]
MPSGDLVLVTGGSGTLGRALTPVLRGAGYRVRLLDVAGSSDAAAPQRDGVEAMVGDVRDPAVVTSAVDGVACVVHAAAWHGIHLRDHPADDFWSLNVEGTFRLYEAAAAAGIRRAVFSSTMGVYGESRRPDENGGAVRVHEDLALLPGDVYGLSKVLGEEMAAYYHRARGVSGVALRYGMFVPEPFGHYGIRLLYGGVDERDVAAAVLAAIRRAEAGDRPFRAYNVESALPYTEADAATLRSDPMSVLRRHWPDAPDLLDRAGLAPWGPINEWFDVSRAAEELGWRPRYNFDEFLDGLRRGAGGVDDLTPAA